MNCSLLAARCSLLALTLTSTATDVARAQAPNCRVAHIWVDPAWGVDDPTAEVDDYINDPANACRTLQFAIDHMNAYLRRSWTTSNTEEGLVHAMPGLYGPHGPYSSGDTFPIWMQDRVHVQGTGARECVIRGGGANTFGTFWPQPSLPPFGPAPQDKEVLIAYRDSSQFSRNVRGAGGTAFVPPASLADLAPWVGAGETAEMLDGFTLQGGDVQVYINPPYPSGSITFDFPLAARITNCVFDMRHQWVATEQVDGPMPLASSLVNGPTFGVLMAKPFHGESTLNRGYFDQEVLVASNTFLMAEWRSGSGWVHVARANAVAIMDVVDPNPIGAVGVPDPNQQLRGLGRANIINNVFRTWPGQQSGSFGQMAMLGIDRSDTRVIDDNVGGSILRETNAFEPSRVGAQNQTFASIPTAAVQVGVAQFILGTSSFVLGPLFDCAAPCPTAPLPVPAVVLWDGSANTNPQPFDPGFVGEYLSSLNGVPSGYRDWRLLPESPLIDAGWYSEDMNFENGVTRFLPGTVCPEIESFDWDSEGYGNPRIVGERIDIGCDEMHMLIMAGSWANDSKGHNINQLPKSHLHPSAADGVTTRQMITLKLFVGQDLRINGTMSTPAIQPPRLPMWVQPPVTLLPPTFDAGAMPDFKVRYISQGNPAPAPTPWIFQGLNQTTWDLGLAMGMPVASAQSHEFVRVSLIDNEYPANSSSNSYFNTQALVDFGTPGARYRSNLQAEYR